MEIFWSILKVTAILYHPTSSPELSVNTTQVIFSSLVLKWYLRILFPFHVRIPRCHPAVFGESVYSEIRDRSFLSNTSVNNKVFSLLLKKNYSKYINTVFIICCINLSGVSLINPAQPRSCDIHSVLVQVVVYRMYEQS